MGGALYYDIVIIGAGAAGLFAAASIRKGNVLVLEKCEKSGNKIVISGGGRCNFTNYMTAEEMIEHYFEKKNFVKPAIYNLPPKDLIAFFKNRGLGIFTDDNGRVFPESMRGNDIRAILLRECNRGNVSIKYSETITTLKKSRGVFAVETDKAVYKSRFLIMATGGKSYPAVGTTGDGYKFAKMLGHGIVQLEPALTPVKIRENMGETLAGISIKEITVTVLRSDKKIIKKTGDLLFTHNGLSGPVILDLSRGIRRGDILKVSLTNFSNEEDLSRDFNGKIAKNGKKQIINLISMYGLPNRISVIVSKMSGLDKNTRCGDLSKRYRRKIVDNLFLKYHVEGKMGFKKAMLTRGGVDTREIDAHSLESKLVSGLYFAGEVIDVDGESGGYNLNFAFSSGKLVAKNISKKIGL